MEPTHFSILPFLDVIFYLQKKHDMYHIFHLFLVNVNFPTYLSTFSIFHTSIHMLVLYLNQKKPMIYIFA